MKLALQQLLQQVIADLGVTDFVLEVEISDDAAHGEYTTNLALRIAKQLKKSPREIALWVKESLETRESQDTHDKINHNINQIDQNVSSGSSVSRVLQAIDHVEVAGPGFLNFFLTQTSLVSQIPEVLKMTESDGKSQFPRKRIMVEYTDTNPFKELHIGHLYSNAVGESLARLYESLGWEVKRADYFGDVGMHVAKSIWGMKKKLQETPAELGSLESLGKKSLADRVHWLGQCYALGATIYEEKSPLGDQAREEMKDINYLVYLAAQEYMQKTLSWQPQIDYRQYVKASQGKYQEIKTLFETGRKWSMDYFETIFRRLGTQFDYYYPESIVGEYGAKLVKEHADIFTKSEGAVIFEGEKVGLHNRVFINSLGLPTYEAKELGLNWKKFTDFSPDLSLNVTGNEINEYFKVLFAVMRQVIPEVAAKTRHVGHGMVRIPSGKMSSRTGVILTGEWLIEEVKKRVYDYLGKSHLPGDRSLHLEGAEYIAEKVAIAAIKYSFLRVALPADLIFDFAKSLSLEGESGPYLLYTYARCKSVMRKAGDQTEKLNAKSYKLNTEEHNIVRLITFYFDIVNQAADELAPNKLCTYLYHLAQAFNLFYQKHSILGNSGDSSERSDQANLRLVLTSSVSRILQHGLYLLGIATVERM